MQKIFININFKNSKIHKYFIDSYKEIIKKYNVKVLVYWKDFLQEDFNMINTLKENWIELIKYKNKNKLISEIINLSKNNNIVYINTFFESLLPLVQEIKKELWIITTNNSKLFRNKEVQRKLLLKYDKNITVNFLVEKVWYLDYNYIKEKIWLPFIIKPKSWYGSSWVSKIYNINDFEKYKYENKNTNNVLIEEYIDWEMYSIDYFVDNNWGFTSTKVVKIELAKKLWINDFFNLSRTISKETEKDLNKDLLQNFIKKTIKATWIKNSFIHHEFKLTTKQQLKTIEINWRIWGYRLEMYKEAYDLNLLSLVFKKIKIWKIINNISIFALYPSKKWILKSYNYKLLEEIKKLESFYSLRILPEKYEGREIWLTKNWFSNIWWIKLKNKNHEQLKKDCDFVEKNYRHLTYLS